MAPTIVARGATSMTVTATCNGSAAEFPSCGWRSRTFTTTLRSAPGSRRKFYATSTAPANAATNGAPPNSGEDPPSPISEDHRLGDQVRVGVGQEHGAGLLGDEFF